ncbi:MAG: DUF3299 domain-containing protein [Candidatus Hydrogenedentes bacterium]|nr:DUF3299 domain-containing protein [Candidatus Hydrogenedentota bacterium]
MRKRSKRDLLTLLGLVIIVVSIISVNGYLRRAGLREHFEKMRAALEQKHRSEGVKLIDWTELHAVVGNRRTGATFPESLKEKDGRLVNIVGFMNAIDQFRNVTEFMLLPVPITCFFCDVPPMRDIIEVKLQQPANMINEPVLVGGRLRIHEGPKPLFFYTIEDAKWNEAVSDEESTDKVIEQEHKLHLIDGFKELRGESPLLDLDDEEELLPGYEINLQTTAPESTEE